MLYSVLHEPKVVAIEDNQFIDFYITLSDGDTTTSHKPEEPKESFKLDEKLMTQSRRPIQHKPKVQTQNELRPYVCQECNLAYTTLWNLHRHALFKHNEQGHFETFKKKTMSQKRILAQLGVQPCINYAVADCYQSGYCYLVANECVNRDCHKVTEIQACQSGGALYSNCRAVPITQHYMNVCGIINDGYFFWGYANFPRDPQIIYSPTVTISGLPVSVLLTTQHRQHYLHILFSTNIIDANVEELGIILDAYIYFRDALLSNESEVWLIEQAIKDTLINIRENPTMTSMERISLLIQMWQVVDILYTKIRLQYKIYRKQHYIVQFISIPISQLKERININKFTYIIEYPSYTFNGYLEITVLPAAQFGIMVSTDILVIKARNADGLLMANQQFKLTLDWTGYGVITSLLKFYVLDPTVMEPTNDASLVMHCNETPNQCYVDLLPIPNGYGFYYPANQACAGRVRIQCRTLRNCNWSERTQICT